MARDTTPARSSWGPPRWAVFIVAMVGAWLGHFLEYVRVSGWHGGLAQMTGADHAYFMPAGAGLVAVVVGGAIFLRRVWQSLGRRLRNAESLLRRPPKRASVPPETPGRRPVADVGSVAFVRLWFVLALLQTAIWTTQENLESIAIGHRAPLFGVLGGAHALAPLVQAEVALLLAGVCVLVRWGLHQRHVRVAAIERIVARRWLRTIPVAPVPVAPTFASTPLERWGAQRWQRPPPSVATV